MTDLFEWAESYPRSPGFKEPTTSRDAAKALGIKASRIREAVLQAIREAGQNGMTAHECAAALERDKMVVSPRISELRSLGKVYPTEDRRKNASRLSAIVWRAR